MGAIRAEVAKCAYQWFAIPIDPTPHQFLDKKKLNRARDLGEASLLWNHRRLPKSKERPLSRGRKSWWHRPR